MKFETVNLNDFVTNNAPGQPARISSRVIAKYFDKLHKDVLKSIQNLECDKEFTERNFAPSSFVDPSGKKNPEILLTREGCMFLIMGFTGKKAAKIKQELVVKFMQMERYILKLEKRWADAQIRRQSNLSTSVRIANSAGSLKRPIDLEEEEPSLDTLLEQFQVGGFYG